VVIEKQITALEADLGPVRNAALGRRLLHARDTR
jgi:hypothetical protein